MFENIANFFQGKGWTNNAQLDEEKKRREQQASIPTAPFSVSQPGAPQLILQKPQIQTPQPVQQAQPANGFWDNVNDFTAQANDSFFRDTLTRGGANIINSFATGFNGDETKKRTEDFLRSIAVRCK
jgi:hypothetical protein